MNLTFAANLTKMIDAGLGREAAPPETFVAVGRTTEYTDLGPVPIASFETNVEAALRALSVSMEPIQAGTGDPSPENVRPITGRSAVNVTRTGKNWFGNYTVLNAYIAGSGRLSGSSNDRSYIIPVKPSTTYTFNITRTAITSENDDCQIGAFATTARPVIGDVGSRIYTSGYYNNKILATFTTPDDANWIAIKIANVQKTNVVETAKTATLEIGSVATAYEPYNGQAVTVQLGQTVYGGSLDVVRGVLTVDWVTVDLGTLNWGVNVSGLGENIFTSTGLASVIASKNCLCSVYPVNVSDSRPLYMADPQLSINRGGVTSGSISGGAIVVKDSTHIGDDGSAFKAAMDGVQLCYELATPQTIQLTPEQITTLIGQNNVWSDGGDVSLTYGTVKYTEGY